jgi:ribose transport system substrate-binding protein
MSRLTLFAVLYGALIFGIACKEEVSVSEAEGNKKSYTFGIIAKSNDNVVFQVARKGAEDAAKDLSEKHGLEVKVAWRTPNKEDAQIQANNIEQLASSGVDGIGISCTDANRVKSAIDTAIDKGIPVMAWDSDAIGSKRFCFYGVDNEASGRAVMTELAKALNGKGVVAVLAGNQTAPNLQLRVKGVRAVADEYPDITIDEVYYHDEDPQSAAQKVEQVQTTHPEIDGWAMVGGWAIFSDALLKNAAFKNGDVKLVSIDALPLSLPYIRQGIAPILLAQPVYDWGYRAVEILFDKAHFKKGPAQELEVAELVPVTMENIDEYEKNWEKWQP